MRKCLFVAVLALASLGVTANRASAWWYQPTYGVAAFPMIYPPGWYANSYYFAWYYPWYANYNYSHGWYANWWIGGGYAFYPGQQFPPYFHIHIPGGPAHMHPVGPPPHDHVLPLPKKDGLKKDAAKKEPAKVSILLPADAKLTFNGAVAAGTGESRVYLTTDLEPGRDYEYVLMAEVMRDGQMMTATQRVIVRAGEETAVALKPGASARK